MTPLDALVPTNGSDYPEDLSKERPSICSESAARDEPEGYLEGEGKEGRGGHDTCLLPVENTSLDPEPITSRSPVKENESVPLFIEATSAVRVQFLQYEHYSYGLL
jgi:hypothetical protein